MSLQHEESHGTAELPSGKLFAELWKMTQQQRDDFFAEFDARRTATQQASVYLRNGEPVIKALTLSRLLGWDHNSILAGIKRWLTNGQPSHFFETDDSLLLDYEVTRNGYQILVDEFGISNQEQANNDDAICAAFDAFKATGDIGTQPPEEIALAVEMAEDLMHKYIGHLEVESALRRLYKEPEKYQHYQSLLNLFHLSFLDGCLFISDRCPLVDYDLLSWHPNAQRDIPHNYDYAVRPSIVIRLFESKIDSDIPY